VKKLDRVDVVDHRHVRRNFVELLAHIGVDTAFCAIDHVGLQSHVDFTKRQWCRDRAEIFPRANIVGRFHRAQFEPGQIINILDGLPSVIAAGSTDPVGDRPDAAVDQIRLDLGANVVGIHRCEGVFVAVEKKRQTEDLIVVIERARQSRGHADYIDRADLEGFQKVPLVSHHAVRQLF